MKIRTGLGLSMRTAQEGRAIRLASMKVNELADASKAINTKTPCVLCEEDALVVIKERSAWCFYHWLSLCEQS